MIKGNCNNAYKYVAPYVLTQKNRHYDYREYPGYLAGDGLPVMSVNIVHSDIYNGRWIYFAWVELEDLNEYPREILMEFDQDELFDTPQEAWNEQEKHVKALRAVCYKYARCYHHRSTKKQGLFARVKNFLAKKDQAGTPFPACDERAKGGAQTLPAPIFSRRVL